MSIERYAMLNSNNATLQGVGIAMLKNVMDAEKQMGAELAQMMEQSVNPSLGSNIDLRV
ncbi:MAG: YjfB family protein [Eubacterium sp.]|nr:YjfB family protein [Eubacterium sp.]